MRLEIFNLIFTQFGFIRSIFAVFSFFAAHCAAFLMFLTPSVRVFSDVTLISNITVAFSLYIVSILVLSTVISHAFSAARSLLANAAGRSDEELGYLSHIPTDETKDWSEKFHYFVERRFGKITILGAYILGPIAATWQFVGFFGLFFLFPIVLFFSWGLPIVYPAVGYRLKAISEDKNIKDKWAKEAIQAFLDDDDCLKEAFRMAVLASILVSATLGATRHVFLSQFNLLMFELPSGTEEGAYIGTLSHGYIIYQSDVGYSVLHHENLIRASALN